jgi:hypothetical protein
MGRSFNKNSNSKDQAGVTTEEKGKAGPGEEGSRGSTSKFKICTPCYSIT